MRMLIGMILGSVLTFGSLYVADNISSGTASARPMVNWDIVAKNFNGIVATAKEGWKKIGG